MVQYQHDSISAQSYSLKLIKMAASLCRVHGRNIARSFSKFTGTSVSVNLKNSVFNGYRRYSATGNQNSINREGDKSSPRLPTSSSCSEVEELEDVAEFFGSLNASTPQEAETVMKHWTRTTLRGGTSKILTSSSLTKAQVLGFTTSILIERLEFLKSCGIEGKDALVIAIDFPCFLEWDGPEFREMLQILKSLGCNITKHLAKNPLIFSLNLDRSLDNVQKLQDAGVPDRVIGKIVDHNPLVLAYPFTSYALEMINFMAQEGEIAEKLRTNRTYISLEEFLIKLLSQPLDKPRKQAVFGENFRGAAHFLKELQVSSRLLVLSCPEFFNTDPHRLNDALMFFMGKPLLFETELVQGLVINRPEIFINFNLEQANRSLNLAASILQNPLKLYWLLQNCYFFEEEGNQLESKIEMFREHGFEDNHIAQILTYKHFFAPKGRDLKERMQFLLSNEEITVDRIAEYPLCLLLSLDNLRTRIAFVKSKNPAALKGTEMKKIFDMKRVNYIIKMCDSSPEEYQKFKMTLSNKG